MNTAAEEAREIIRVANCVPGTRVKRSNDWCSEQEDYQYGSPGLGTIIECEKDKALALVQWDNGNKAYYHSIGAFETYELYLATETGERQNDL